MTDVETDGVERVVVAGSRSIKDVNVVFDTLESVDDEWEPETYVHGSADGVDELVDSVVEENPFGPSGSVETHPIPDWVWEQVGKKAGPMRNEYMVENADALVAIWDGESSGTKNVVKLAEGNNLLVRRVVCSGSGDDWTIESDRTYDERDQAQLGDF